MKFILTIGIVSFILIVHSMLRIASIADRDIYAN